jgi:poly-beta-1,6-N-acetyl-D-glucosamine biosynthesis protein PgaD
VIDRWPPLIDRARVPLRNKLRDYLLTLLAWALMLYLLWPLLDILVELVQVGLGLREALPQGHARLFFQELLPFFKLILLFSLSLTVFAIGRRKHISATIDTRKPPAPLDPDRQATWFKLQPEQMTALQNNRISIVYFHQKKMTDIKNPEQLPGAEN